MSTLPRMLLLLSVVISASGCATSGPWYTAEPIRPPTVAMPMDVEAAKAQWNWGMPATKVADEILQRDVLEIDAANNAVALRDPVAGPCEVVLLMRLIDDSRQHGVLLNFSRGGEGAYDFDYSMNAYFVPHLGPRGLQVGARYGTGPGAQYLNLDELRHDEATQNRMTPVIYFRERFYDISPVWDPEFRQETEGANAQLPLTKNTWFELRIVKREDAIQFYKDGFLIGERIPAGRTNGNLELRVMGKVRVGAFTVRPIAPRAEKYVPIGIAERCNTQAQTLGVKTETLRGTVHVGSIPFEFPQRRDGKNVIDVGQSLFHYRNREGHTSATEGWPALGMLDPGQIAFSVSNRPYTRLWVVAASQVDENKVPLITVRFYRPQAGFPIDAQARIPLLTARGNVQGARRLPITSTTGAEANLWLVPIDLDAVRIASEFREEATLSMEITKEVFPWRGYPDPADYSWYPGGLPSAVHLFAMTLEEAPVRFLATSNRSGNVFVSPEEPVWLVKLQNLRDRETQAHVQVKITDPQGKLAQHTRTIPLAPFAGGTAEIPFTASTTGLHDVVTTVQLDDDAKSQFTQTGTFVQTPPDSRTAAVKNARWGIWNWNGAHGTNPNALENLYLNRVAGARYGGMGTPEDRRKWGMNSGPQHLIYGPEAWANKDPIDQKEYDECKERIGKRAAEMLAKNPDIPSFSLFTETAISERITYGVPPEYLGEGELVMNDAEKARYRAFTITLKAACEGIRQHAPEAKIALAWCEPIFAVPFLKDKFPAEMFDFIGVDSPQFERMPEMPIREVSPARMWMLKEAMKKYGYEKKPVIHTESYYPSSHPLALGFRQSADSVVRTAVLALAQGTTIFANCWTMFDCSNYWGSQHYGCIGLIGRRPEYNPKPAFPAFATMTRLIEAAPYDGFVDTGTQSVYCVRFKYGAQLTYCLWTIRGTRSVTLRFAKDAQPVLVPESSADQPLTLTNNEATIELSPTPVWVRSKAAIEAVTPGMPTYTDKPSTAHTRPLDALTTPWNYDPAEYTSYATNHWGMPRFAGPMKSEAVNSVERKTSVWQVVLDTPAKERPLGTWYGVFTPPQPMVIPGKAKALGIWANGKSNWGRIVYEIEDAKGERWQSVGTRDDWNCDDVHNWSSFNFDGWRYLEFPLPNHQPGDNYREYNTVWWNHNADGVVDLPVKLTRVIIEQRTHNVYVDKLVPNADRSVQLSNLIAVYANPENMTDAPVLAQQRAAHLLKFDTFDPALLPNAVATLATTGVGAATTIEKVVPPDHGYDGTRVDVALKPVEGAKEYHVYVSAYASGAGAKQMAKNAEPKMLVSGLRAEFPLYLFVTYLDAAGKESKPSAGSRVLLKDDFPMK